MKEKIDLKHIISEPLGKRWSWYKKMSDYHEKVHPRVKLANGLAIVSLAVASACNAQELSSPRPLDSSEPIPTQPAPGDLGEIIENPTASAESALERVTGTFSEVSPYSLESVKNQYPELKDKNVSTFAIKINQNLFEYATTADVDPKESWAVISGNISVQGQQIIADQMTIQDEKLFLRDNAGIWKELVKVRIEGQGTLPDVFAWYLFDQRPNPNGTIDLSLTKSVLAYPALSEEEWIKQTSGPTRDRPVMIMWAPWQPQYIYPRWETDYVVIPIISYQSIPGGAKDALVVSQRPQMTATPEPASTVEATQVINENDLDIIPSSIESVDVIFMGVHIKGAFGIDKTFTARSGLRISDEAHAEYIAKTFYKVWLEKGGPNGTGPEVTLSFEEYMFLWAKAQKTNNQNDWNAVQIVMSLNILDDTNGFHPKKLTVWPMSSVQAPDATVSFENVVIPVVKAPKMKNIALDPMYGGGYGPNLDISKSTLYFYLDPGQSSYDYSLPTLIGSLNKIIIGYNGSETYKIFKTHDKGLYDFLIDHMVIE